MARFLLRRCLLVLPSLLGLLVVTFLLIHAVPSDPAVSMAGEGGTPEQIARLRQQYGLDKPIWEQFAVYVGKVVHHAGAAYLMAFRNQGPDGQFVGGLIDPVPVTWRPDGHGLVLDVPDRPVQRPDPVPPGAQPLV